MEQFELLKLREKLKLLQKRRADILVKLGNGTFVLLPLPYTNELVRRCASEEEIKILEDLENSISAIEKRLGYFFLLPDDG